LPECFLLELKCEGNERRRRRDVLNWRHSRRRLSIVCNHLTHCGARKTLARTKPSSNGCMAVFFPSFCHRGAREDF
jgi:hypothetical protein